MTKVNYKIQSINPTDLSGFRELPNEDLILVTSADIVSSFIPNQNAVEVSYYTLDDVRLSTVENYTRYSILSGDRNNNQPGNSEISIDVLEDYKAYGFEGEEIKVVYNFLDFLYTNTLSKQLFYIDTISSDRTEVRLVSLNLTPDEVLETTNELQERINNDTYKSDFNISFGNNLFYSIVNIKSQEYKETNAVIIKLLQPLPIQVSNKSTLSLVEKVANSVAYEVNFTVEEEKISGPVLRGANFTVEIEEQSTEPSSYYDYNELFSFPVNNSNRQLNSLFNEKGAELGIDYTKYSNFINFSSIEERLRNFKYKLDLLEVHQNNLDQVGSNSALAVNYSGTGVSGSVEYYTSLVTGIVNNFDHYERHLFYNSGSSSWPKVGNSKPYINKTSTTVEATSWYSAETTKAIDYDAQNPDILINTIASYLKEDTTNDPYLMFVHMIGQHFDNLWTYTDAVSKKYDTDNRLNVGVSKDLVEQLLKNFGVKLYTSNKSVEDLFRYFTVNSYEPGEEKLDLNNPIQSGKDPLSQNDYQKEIYKRIYHNLPLLMKSKGTERGLRALINCFGIPSDVLKLKIFGGQSAQNTPFYGGEQAWTGSLDKVRVDNTGSIVAGDTLSFYTPITRLDDKYTQDLHRIEIGFSPSDNVNAYIVSQSAYLFPNENFNIDQYIGDPRGYETNKYLDLYNYAKLVFNNVSAYNVKDFVRLIKFFDNVLFRMVKDFTPARSVTDSGIIIKPHLLERYKAEAPVMTWTQPIFSGSISTAFISGSDGGIYKSNAIGSYSTPDDPNNAFNREASTAYNLRKANPFTGSLGVADSQNSTVLYRPYVYLNEFHKLNPNIPPQIRKSFNEAKFDGELANSFFSITNGELNQDNPFKNIDYPTIKYDTQFWTNIPDSVCILNSPPDSFFVTGSGISIYIPSSDIFQGDTPYYIYTGPDGGELPNDTLVIPSTADQYEEFEVVATHPDNPIPNSITGEDTCERSRTVKVVNCELVSPQGNSPGLIQNNQPYNLLSWFFDPQNIDEVINTNLTFFVNEINIGEVNVNTVSYNGITTNFSTPYGELGTPTNYIFENIDDLSNLTVTAADEFDNNCNSYITLPVDTCPLRDTFESNSGAVLPDRALILPTIGNLFYAYPFGFAYANSTTLFQFRVQVILHKQLGVAQEDREGPWGFTAWFDIEFDATPDSPAWSLGTASVVPNAWTADVGTPSITGDINQNGASFPQVLQDPKFQNTNTTPNPFLDNGLPIPSSDPNNKYFNGNFTRVIQFRAVNSLSCEVVGQVFGIDRGETIRSEVEFIFFSGTSTLNSYPANACMQPPANDNNKRTVYVEHSTDVSPPTPAQVISNGFTIYASDTGNNLAQQGYYLYDPAGSEYVNAWSIGRRGRVWKEFAADGIAGVAWDFTTETDMGVSGFSAGTFWFNTGRFICEGPDATDGDGDDGGGLGLTDSIEEDEDASGNIGTGSGGGNPYIGGPRR